MLSHEGCSGEEGGGAPEGRGNHQEGGTREESHEYLQGGRGAMALINKN